MMVTTTSSFSDLKWPSIEVYPCQQQYGIVWNWGAQTKPMVNIGKSYWFPPQTTHMWHRQVPRPSKDPENYKTTSNKRNIEDMIKHNFIHSYVQKRRVKRCRCLITQGLPETMLFSIQPATSRTGSQGEQRSFATRCCRKTWRRTEDLPPVEIRK